MPKKKEVKAPPRTRYLSIRMEEDLYQTIAAECSDVVTMSSIIRGILRIHYRKQERRNAQ